MNDKSDMAHAARPVASTDMSRRDVLALAGATASVSVIPTLLDSTAMAETAVASITVLVSFTVNDQRQQLNIDPRQSLLDVLRETLDLPGTKKGCNQGACGACTVLVDGRRIVSCLTLASMHDDAQIETIEGLEKDGELHPLQEAFVAHEGLQCGFCTSGQIMSGLGCIAEGHSGSPEEIQFWMSGNICRCGAYPGIVAAVADAAKRS
ncbi:(2Fe-2S)-binding protein [Mesorhizobium sp. ZC-5]|nr:(2Fe-2S)-binding protein [Mesorhizobium sp. ZC-5]MCV3240655.1 (2Fe-2S)-binding protein [Mesorhizobium sp. ZC-5]